MIFESCYWKDPLLKMAERVARYQAREELTERQGAQLERDLFIGFYSVRKLFEAGPKISDETRVLKLAITRFQKLPKAKPVDHWNRYEINDLFDLSLGVKENRDVLFVAGRIIHSLIFVTQGPSEGSGSGIYFSSDRDKDRSLYFIESEEVVRLFQAVGTDYPNLSKSWRDPVTGEIRWESHTVRNDALIETMSADEKG